MVDVYSCSPVAAPDRSRELKLDTSKPLTVTVDSLGPAALLITTYALHVRMAAAERRGQKGLITANGGYITKHAFGVYSNPEPTFSARQFTEPSRSNAQA